MNFKGWKKVRAEADHTVMKNHQGHELRIAHKPLSKPHLKALQDLPTAFVDGGEVEDKDKQQAPVIVNVGAQPPQTIAEPINTNAAQLAQTIQPNNVIPAQAPMAATPQNSFEMSNLADIGAPAPPPQAPAATPVSTPSPQGTLVAYSPTEVFTDAATPTPKAPVEVQPALPPLSGFEKNNMGQVQEAQALGDLGKQKAVIQQEAVNHEQKLQSNFRQTVKDLEDSRKQLAEAVIKKEINPDQFWSNRSTPSKIATTIGLLLGGMGGGLLHQENPALKFLNSQIDRDIEAQKAELGKKENLLKLNMSHFGNVQQATEMTRIMMNDAVNHKLEQAIAKSVDPQAKAKLEQVLGDRIALNQVAQEKLAAQRALDTFMQGGTPEHIPQMIAAVRKFDPKQAEELNDRHVPGMGFANTGKDADVLKPLKGSTDSAKEGITQLLAMQKKPFKSLSTEDRAKASTIVGSMIGLLKEPIVGSGTMSDTDKALIENLLANPTAIFSLDDSNKVKLKTLYQRLDSNLNHMAKARGVRMIGAGTIPELPPQR